MTGHYRLYYRPTEGDTRLRNISVKAADPSKAREKLRTAKFGCLIVNTVVISQRVYAKEKLAGRVLVE